MDLWRAQRVLQAASTARGGPVRDATRCPARSTWRPAGRGGANAVGRRDRLLIDRIDAEYRRYFTPPAGRPASGRPRSTGCGPPTTRSARCAAAVAEVDDAVRTARRADRATWRAGGRRARRRRRAARPRRGPRPRPSPTLTARTQAGRGGRRRRGRPRMPRRWRRSPSGAGCVPTSTSATAAIAALQRGGRRSGRRARDGRARCRRPPRPRPRRRARRWRPARPASTRRAAPSSDCPTATRPTGSPPGSPGSTPTQRELEPCSANSPAIALTDALDADHRGRRRARSSGPPRQVELASAHIEVRRRRRRRGAGRRRTGRPARGRHVVSRRQRARPRSRCPAC